MKLGATDGSSVALIYFLKDKTGSSYMASPLFNSIPARQTESIRLTGLQLQEFYVHSMSTMQL